VDIVLHDLAARCRPDQAGAELQRVETHRFFAVGPRFIILLPSLKFPAISINVSSEKDRCHRHLCRVETLGERAFCSH